MSPDQSFLATKKHEHDPTQWAKASFCICFYIQWTFNYKLRVHLISIVLKAFLRLLQKVIDCGLTKVTLITSNITNFQWCLLASPTLETSIFFPKKCSRMGKNTKLTHYLKVQLYHLSPKINFTLHFIFQHFTYVIKHHQLSHKITYGNPTLLILLGTSWYFSSLYVDNG